MEQTRHEATFKHASMPLDSFPLPGPCETPTHAYDHSKEKEIQFQIHNLISAGAHEIWTLWGIGKCRSRLK